MIMTSIPHLFIAGLGNFPYPITRHRLAFQNQTKKLPDSSNSIGQFVIDALASRLGIRMSSVKGGYSGQGRLLVGDTVVALTLFKSSTRTICPLLKNK